MQMLSYHSVNANLYELVIKDIAEKILAFILILITLPISLISSILIKITSNGPIFFTQNRVGLRGRHFKQYKFRSMEIDSEKKQQEIMHMNEQSGPVFKIKNDPRITKIGKLIRKFSIDELPQLINVLKGNMSLIGPRPLPVYEVEKFDSEVYYRRHSMKPGITGLWQVSGRNSIQSFDDWVKIDLNYIDNWSFWLDIKIAIRTFFVILSGSGK
ncbi:MAG: hypothetical protein CBD58_00480 [bacterium TMED198]|nr:MAG: hypothetical protein CBD58_00480 [bacterium TMED198]